MAHNVVVGDLEGPTWLKKKNRTGAGRDTMDGRGYVRPKGSQVMRIVDIVCTMWAEEATRWWDEKLAADPNLARWDGRMRALVCVRPGYLQVESRACEQGNRQKKALVGKITKGTWAPHGPKEWARVRAMHVGPHRQMKSVLPPLPAHTPAHAPAPHTARFGFPSLLSPGQIAVALRAAINSNSSRQQQACPTSAGVDLVRAG
eukprot:5672759-Prymnesium_polylepis.1